MDQPKFNRIPPFTGFLEPVVKTLLLIVPLLLLKAQGQGQPITSLSLEAGSSWNICMTDDPGGFFRNSYAFSNYSGVTLWQEVMKDFSIGAGITFQNFSAGINPDDKRTQQPAWQNFGALMIPVRLSYRIHPTALLVSFTPRIGYHYGIVLPDPPRNQISSLISNEDGLVLQYDLDDQVIPTNRMHLLETGVSVDYRFSNNWQLSWNLSWITGFQTVKNSVINYSTATGENYTATYSSDGSSFQSTIALSAPVSNLWENKEVRIHRKIENSTNRGTSSRVINRIYLSGDIGAVWRSFATTNPAVAARPIKGKGLFRYSNLNAGASVGYMFRENAGVEIGAYYRRSATCVSLMYDHEADFNYRERAPMFLELPIMIRYFLHFEKSRISLTPSAGISVITHFSGRNFSTGSGTFEYSGISGAANGTVDIAAGRTGRVGFSMKAGLGIDYPLPINFPLFATLNISRSHGFLNLDSIAVTTSVAENPEASSITYNGSGWYASLGVRVPIILGKENRRCGAMPGQ